MPVVKGGVWTNIEDEILKASVSKYGLNQWQRVSSLLARKTAKQCKARWIEWLDPGIRKVEWSKEEDEKLLHLAKLMPTQWRTIAPIVGRTATQCLERYQRLLDEAEARENDELGLGGPEGGETSAPTGDDVRKLRPGETDPDPESKPARPDTIDLDEDEKEMLSEARARLANTQGKKAKRKARERQLEESRRLAVLQKRRELKNAGINIKITNRKKGQMDYNADIPFEKAPAAGFYDTIDEKTTNERERESFDPRKQQLARKRQGDQEEEKDPKRQKQEKDKAAAAAAARAGQMQKMREAEQQSRRRALNLPAPQVSDAELEDIVKMGMAGERAVKAAGEDDTDAQRLVSSYSNTVGQTPIRTPQAPAQEDHIANEIRNIRALNDTQSSLLGGENTPLHEGHSSTGFDGIAPRKSQLVTPNPLATPLRQQNGANGVGATPHRTPARDNYSLNATSQNALVPSTPAEQRSAEQAHKVAMRAKLASLPRPKATTWELELDEPTPESSVGTDAAVREDQGEIDRRAREAAEAQARADFKRQSTVYQRALPRPTALDYTTLSRATTASSTQDSIRTLIQSEAALLMAHDLRAHPPTTTSTLSGTVPPLPMIPDSSMAAARALLAAECDSSDLEAHHAALSEHYATLDLNAHPLPTFLPPTAPSDAYHGPFGRANNALQTLASSDQKLEATLKKLHGGYAARQKALRLKIEERFAEVEAKRVERECFATLAMGEEAALVGRLERLRGEVALVSRREREAQDVYRGVREGLTNGSS
jgi:pre-mRNA-splicing factor CDC5/CEF1